MRADIKAALERIGMFGDVIGLAGCLQDMQEITKETGWSEEDALIIDSIADNIRGICEEIVK